MRDKIPEVRALLGDGWSVLADGDGLLCEKATDSWAREPTRIVSFDTLARLAVVCSTHRIDVSSRIDHGFGGSDVTPPDSDVGWTTIRIRP